MMRGPVLVRILHLAGLADEVAHLADRRRLAPDRLRVAECQRRGAAGAAARAARHRRAGQDDHEVGPEAFDLLPHRLVGALADRDHGDQRRDADEHAEHGERRAHPVAADRLRCRGQHHRAERPGCGRPRRSAGGVAGAGIDGAGSAAPMRGRVPGGARPAFVRNDLSIAHGQDAIRIGGDVGLVRDHDDRDAAFAIERGERLHDLVRRAGVEVAGRLVRQQQARVVDQRARDRDPLLLAAGELARRVALTVAQAEQPERRACALGARSRVCRRRGRVEQRQCDVLERAGARQQIEALEHEAEPLAAQRARSGSASAATSMPSNR